MPRLFKNFSVCHGNTSAKRLPKTQHRPLYITSAITSAYIGTLPRAMIWFLNSRNYLLCLNYIFTYNTLERVKRETISLSLIICFGFFVCPCYSRTHYSTLEKHGAQNVAACENQGKQYEFSSH